MLGYVPEIAALKIQKAKAQRRDNRRYELAKTIAAALIQSETWSTVLRVEFVPKTAVEIADAVLAALERESVDGNS